MVEILQKERKSTMNTAFRKKHLLTFRLGVNTDGQEVYLPLANQPHLLIAGATGTGKSVCLRNIITSFLQKYPPDEVKLLLIDPKRVEFAMFRDLPHLFLPVATDLQVIDDALQEALREMERRCSRSAEESESLPQIVILIEELADLMMLLPAETEDAICRLAQNGHTVGIHLVVATQRPCDDVLTRPIKLALTSRIAFRTADAEDSICILGRTGAEALNGGGDLLHHYSSSDLEPQRVQGTFVSVDEAERIANALKEQPKT